MTVAFRPSPVVRPPSPSRFRGPSIVKNKGRWLVGVLFLAAGAVFLWVPSLRMWDAVAHFLVFKDDVPESFSSRDSAPSSSPGFLEAAFPFPKDPGAAAKKPRSVTFRLLAPAAREVSLGGDFGAGNKTLSMTRRPDGVWEISLDLAPGRYAYRFRVDGQWELDPTNPERTPAPTPRSIVQIQ